MYWVGRFWLPGIVLFVSVSVASGQPCTGVGGADPALRAFPSYLSAWQAKYPTSTLPARMEALAGSSCFVCHHPPNVVVPGNCYRDDLIVLLGQGMTIDDAINQLDGVDSDGDGFSNGVEATLARPEPGEVGYNMGLAGPTGTDPCGTNTAEVVTGVSETPPVVEAPALSVTGLAFVFAGFVVGAMAIGRRGRVYVRR